MTKVNMPWLILLSEWCPWRGKAWRRWREHKEVVGSCQVSWVTNTNTNGKPCYKYMLVQIHMEIFLHLDKASSPLLVKLSKQIVEEIVTISVSLLRCECFDQQQPADFGQACTAMCTAAICQESKIALHCHEVGGGLVRRGPGRHLSVTPFNEL